MSHYMNNDINIQTNNPVQLMQMFGQFTNGQNGLNVNNAEQMGRQVIQRANLNQVQLNKIQNMANMLYGMAQKFGMIK